MRSQVFEGEDTLFGQPFTMDVRDITEGEEECAKNGMVVEKLERLRENLRNVGQVAFKIDDILHCLNHCSGILQRDESTIGKLRQGLGDDSGDALGDKLENVIGLLDTYDSEIMTANESVRQQIEYISRDTTIDDCCTRLTDISAGLSHFVESISEPRHHEQVVESVRKVNNTVETIKLFVEGTSAGRSSASRAKAGSKENSVISIYFPPTTRTTRSSDTGMRKSYVEQVNDSDSDMMFGKVAQNKKKIKDESDEEFVGDSNYFQDDYPRNTQPSNRMRNMDSMLSNLPGSGTIDTGSQDLDSDFETEYKTVPDVINKPRPTASSSHNSNSNSKAKIRAIKHTLSQDDPDFTEVSPEMAAGKPVVVPRMIREPGTTRSAFRNVEVSASAKKAPDVAASDRVISIDDENSNEAISIAETETKARRETTASADPHCDGLLGGGSQEETMVRTGGWQAVTYGDHAQFEDLDDRDVSQYQRQADLFPVPPEKRDFPSDDSEGSVSQEEADEDESAAQRKSPKGTGLSTRSAGCGASGSKKEVSMTRAFRRAGSKESPETAAASALVQTIHTPNRTHIREEKLPTPCTAVSTATASSSWPAAREHSQGQSLQQQMDQVPPFHRDDGTGTQSDSEASSSRTRTFDKSKPSGGPRRNTSAAPEDDEVSRVRTGPGRAAQHYHTPRQPPQPAAQMLGALGPLDVRFPSPAETSPAIRSDQVEEYQEWLDTKDRNGKRLRDESEERIGEGTGRKHKQVQSEEVSNHRAPATALLAASPAASPAALPVSRRTRQRENTEQVASAPSMNDIVDLTDV